MKILLKIIAIGVITLVGAGITCGGNILIMESDLLDTIFGYINNFFGLGRQEYIGENIYFYLWAIEIIAIFLGIIYFLFWRYDALTESSKKIFYLLCILFFLIGGGVFAFFFI